jgi:hypothetical protein
LGAELLLDTTPATYWHEVVAFKFRAIDRCVHRSGYHR